MADLFPDRQACMVSAMNLISGDYERGRGGEQGGEEARGENGPKDPGRLRGGRIEKRRERGGHRNERRGLRGREGGGWVRQGRKKGKRERERGKRRETVCRGKLLSSRTDFLDSMIANRGRMDKGRLPSRYMNRRGREGGPE